MSSSEIEWETAEWIAVIAIKPAPSIFGVSACTGTRQTSALFPPLARLKSYARSNFLALRSAITPRHADWACRNNQVSFLPRSPHCTVKMSAVMMILQSNKA